VVDFLRLWEVYRRVFVHRSAAAHVACRVCHFWAKVEWAATLSFFFEMGATWVERSEEKHRRTPLQRCRTLFFFLSPFSFPYSTSYLDAELIFFPSEPPLRPTPTAPFPPPTRPAHALHARLLSWFLDAPAAPFGVHRMALAGMAAGKDVGKCAECCLGAVEVCFVFSFFVCFG
jgi:hypothetical protein